MEVRNSLTLNRLWLLWLGAVALGMICHVCTSRGEVKDIGQILHLSSFYLALAWASATTPSTPPPACQ